MSERTALPSVRVSGSGVVAGGVYDVVHGSGSVKCDGDITAREIRASGSIRIDGSVRSQEFESSGSASIRGGVAAENFSVSGSCTIDGALAVRQTAHASGSMKVAGAVTGEEVEGAGSLRCNDSISLEGLHWRGALSCPGLVTADSIRISLHGTSTIGELAGARIEISLGSSLGILSEIFGVVRDHRLNVDEVSGDVVRLEHTTAKIVRGDEVIIGPKSRIQRVEYRGSLTIDPTSEVAEPVRISRD